MTTPELIRSQFTMPNKSRLHKLAHKCANELEAALLKVLELERELAEAKKPTRMERLIEQDEQIDRTGTFHK